MDLELCAEDLEWIAQLNQVFQQDGNRRKRGRAYAATLQEKIASLEATLKDCLVKENTPSQQHLRALQLRQKLSHQYSRQTKALNELQSMLFKPLPLDILLASDLAPWKSYLIEDNPQTRYASMTALMQHELSRYETLLIRLGVAEASTSTEEDSMLIISPHEQSFVHEGCSSSTVLVPKEAYVASYWHTFSHDLKLRMRSGQLQITIQERIGNDLVYFEFDHSAFSTPKLYLLYRFSNGPATVFIIRSIAHDERKPIAVPMYESHDVTWTIVTPSHIPGATFVRSCVEVIVPKAAAKAHFDEYSQALELVNDVKSALHEYVADMCR